MDNEQWQETVSAARRREAMPRRYVADPDGTDGRASGVEQALHAALASIDAIYAIDSVSTYNADIASPVEVQQFWEKYGELPGFAARN